MICIKGVSKYYGAQWRIYSTSHLVTWPTIILGKKKFKTFSLLHWQKNQLFVSVVSRFFLSPLTSRSSSTKILEFFYMNLLFLSNLQLKWSSHLDLPIDTHFTFFRDKKLLFKTLEFGGKIVLLRSKSVAIGDSLLSSSPVRLV